MQPGDKVRSIVTPSLIGWLTNDTDDPPHRLRYLVAFNDNSEDYYTLGETIQISVKLNFVVD